MDRAASQALIWRLRRLARQLDWLAMAGIGLALFAMGLYFYGIRPLESHRMALNDRVVASLARADTRLKKDEPVQPQAQLAAFYEQLADARQAPEIASRLHAYAHGAGLTLDRGEYRPVPDTSGKFVRYQIVLPVNGSYPQVRRFVADAMRDMPGLALDAISFRREGDTARLQSELRFTAFLRKPA
jgi:Tfp pilus assembly protein PilO